MSAEEEAAVIRIVTRFASLDDLVARAGLLVSADTITVATLAPLPEVGEQRPFQVVLADGTPAIEGVGEVVTGKRLKIIELDEVSRELHDRILAARKQLPRPGARTAPPPFRRTLEGPPSPAAAKAIEPEPEAVAAIWPVVTDPLPPPPIDTPARVAAPVPVPAKDPTPPPARLAGPPPSEETLLVAGAWAPPPWLVTRKAKITMGTVAVILLIGIVAAIAGGDGGKPSAPTTIAGAAPIDAGTKAQPPVSDPGPPPDAEPAGVDAGAEADAEPAPEPEPEPPKKPRKATPKRTASKPPPAAKKSAGKIRVAVRSEPKGASVKIDGAAVTGGSAMLTSGSVVTVVATMRGYKRARKTVKVGGKVTSITIKLDKM